MNKFVLLLLWVSECVHCSTVHLYVSPNGSDSNDGRQSSHPVKTLQHVADMLDDDGISGNTVFVEMMEGYYDLPSTLRIPHTPGDVIFRSYQGQEVHVTGGKRLRSDQFHAVTDRQVLEQLPTPSPDDAAAAAAAAAARARVLELDLESAGITDTGTLKSYGFATYSHMPLELYINGRPLRLAEWPNRNFINIQSVPDGQHGKRFTYDSNGRDRAWALETEPWVYGWWYWSWADLSVPVSHVDFHNHTITLLRDTRYGLRVGHYDPSGQNTHAGYLQQGGYFRVVNMLSELDQPGEYYIDRRRKKLFVWPNTPHQTLTSSDVIYASMIDDCILVDSQAGTVHLEDFTLEACRNRGVAMNRAHNVTISRLEIRNTGGPAVQCTGDCRRISILASDIHDVNMGISLSGGDVTTLTPSQNVIRDNHIWDHARYGATPNNALTLSGVGALVSHNHLHHSQYTAIRWIGNDHVMEYNHLHHCCWNSSDCGAIHSGRDWTWRGNIIRYNYIHDVQRHLPGAPVRGIMLDDEYSSVVIEHNVFYDNDVHANIGGGRNNVIRQNVMYNALQHSIQVDGRGLGSGGHGPYMRSQLQKSPYRSALWKSRYPELYNILDNQPEAPQGNQIYENVFYNALGKERIHYGQPSIQRKDYFDVHDNYRALYKVDFWSPDVADFRLRCEAAQWALHHGFLTPPTLEEVGPTVPTGPSYLHKTRPTAPAHSDPGSCDSATVAPATTTPQVSYMPDGSIPNVLYPNISHTGCWLVTDRCPSHPSALGTHEDKAGTEEGTEEGCLARASAQWRWCGAPEDGRVVAVFGPTGAMTFSAKGCYFAEWGCFAPRGGLIHRDTWAEQHQNASVDEEACLSRAVPQWTYCGSSADRPYTSIYGPTGAFRTAGAGCWIKIPSCPADPTLRGFFFEAWGATNLSTGSNKEECLERAEYYWTKCGSQSNAPVTAYYRPTASRHTVP